MKQRRFKRYPVEGITGKIHYVANAKILNISIDGAAIETTHRLNIDQIYSFRLNYKNTDLNIKGQVVWSVLDHSESYATSEIKPVYRAGIRFKNILANEAEELLRFILKNKNEPLEKRIIGIRFKVGKSDIAKVLLPLNYYVKKMSMSGMLIVSDNPLDINYVYRMEVHIDGKILEVNGRIAYCSEVLTEGKDGQKKYHVGIEYIDLSQDSQNILSEYLRGIDK